MVRWLIAILLFCTVAFVPLSCQQQRLRVASKLFTESVILGEMAVQIARSSGTPAVHERQLGGTRLVFDALEVGEIAVYPDYTGTLIHEILADQDLPDTAALEQALAQRELRMTGPLGFNNSYAIGMKEDVAERLQIESISDLTRHPDLTLRFSNEFMDRADGWPNLRRHYQLPQRDVKGVEHDIAYRQLDSGTVDAIDVYTTDARIRYYNLRVLDDDLGYFPTYDAVFVYRAELEQNAPKLVESLHRLEGRIPATRMVELNGQAELLGIPETKIAADFLNEELGLRSEPDVETRAGRIWRNTREHLDLVRTSLLAAILVAVPLGIVSARWPALGQAVLGGVGIVQTIPALALLVVLIKPVNLLGLDSIGAGSATAVIALFLYSLLPIVRNTFAGLNGIPGPLKESAVALGLPPLARLWQIELPMASRTILAGIKTAAVINVGFATLGALIGAGGYGQPILTGIRLNDYGHILEGAVPAAVMALSIQGLFDLLERALVSKGLRLEPDG